MKIRFDASQPYQLDAVQAAVDLFEGQPAANAAFELQSSPDQLPGLEVLGFGNRMVLSDEALLANLNTVQKRNGIDASPQLAGPHFAVEMETGTGKTYIYLRTIFALHRTYGFSKFVIVVPSVAIREGVLSSLRLMREHFEALYDKPPMDSWVYDAKQVSRLRQFATASTLQILVINIDAFNRQTNNIIHKENDRLSGYKPIEFIQSAQPIAILDEPQNMESETARAAIESLNPACTLRYSATHRNSYNLIYRLNPVQAYDLGLVKRIEVDSVLEEADFNRPYLALTEVKAVRSTMTAKIELDVETPEGVKRKKVTLKPDGDLELLSNGRSQYAGYLVSEFNTETRSVTFTNGVTLAVGQSHGTNRDDLMRVQVRNTIREHFDKELQQASLPAERRMKVLSLFFIDKVANYYEADGKIRLWFVEEYTKISAEPKYAALKPLPVDRVHNGYFAASRGVPADSREGRNTQADDEAYELIMRNKEQLLQLDEPLRFLFSHSALREGWDNPNVFQICTLAEARSEIRKRQEIGRGLRLPVMANGERCMDRNLNRLTVIANESYEDFAKRLQSEIEDETGFKFDGGRIGNKRKRKAIRLKKNWQTEEFLALWERIKPRTRYRVEFSTPDLIKRAAAAIKGMPPLHAPTITSRRARIGLTTQEVTTELRNIQVHRAEHVVNRIPDLLAYLQRETELTRSTLAAILRESGRLGEVAVNPQQLLDQAMALIRDTLKQLMVEGIEYEKIAGSWYEMRLFEQGEVDAYENRVQPVAHSIYNAVEFDSDVEQKFAQELDVRSDVRLFLKLPAGFTVDTPLGKYNPDWAIVKHEDTRVYLVRETKGALGHFDLRGNEAGKISCGRKHFDAIGVDFRPVTSASDV